MKLKYNILTQDFMEHLRWVETAVMANEQIPQNVKNHVRSVANELRQNRVYLTESMTNIVYRNAIKSKTGIPLESESKEYVINEVPAKEALEKFLDKSFYVLNHPIKVSDLPEQFVKDHSEWLEGIKPILEGFLQASIEKTQE